MAFTLDLETYLRRSWRSLRRSIDDLEPGFVSIEQLERNSDLGFFNEMLLEELPGEEQVDAYIFLGPDVFVRKNRERELLESIGPLDAPVYFIVNGRAQSSMSSPLPLRVCWPAFHFWMSRLLWLMVLSMRSTHRQSLSKPPRAFSIAV